MEILHRFSLSYFFSSSRARHTRVFVHFSVMGARSVLFSSFSFIIYLVAFLTACYVWEMFSGWAEKISAQELKEQSRKIEDILRWGGRLQLIPSPFLFFSSECSFSAFLSLPPLLNLCDRASVLMVHVDCRQHTAAASAAVWLRFRERLSLVEVRMTFFIPLMSFEVWVLVYWRCCSWLDWLFCFVD